MTDFTRQLLERLFEERGGALRAFFSKRNASQPDIADLTQEVYLRILRVKSAELIQNPEAYLFTVANNLLKEQAVLRRRQANSVDASDPVVEAELSELPRFELDMDATTRQERLNAVLQQLPSKCQAAVALYYQQNLTYQQIGEQLGISGNMVKKYLAQALAHCRKRMMSLKP
ncbi:MAG: sigma-70 family RNA polymerase sigma factor [Steroidobacteraceae bacterium]